MNIDLWFLSFVLVGLAVQLFYNPDSVRKWILNRMKGTKIENMNKLSKMGMELMLISPTYLTFFMKFGIMGFIVFKSYDIVGFDKTVLLLLIVFFISLTNTSRQNPKEP